jgi:hypothetical protein
VTPRKIEIRDGKIARSVDAKLAGKHEGPKFVVGMNREDRPPDGAPPAP